LASEKRPLVGNVPLCPSWAASVAEQDADVRRGQAVAAEISLDGRCSSSGNLAVFTAICRASSRVEQMR
jgi:hypothetical protein